MAERKRFGKKVEKLWRRHFSPPLTETETIKRIEYARQVSQALGESEEWKSWITGVYLYGSTARGEARRSSDIDLAITTKQEVFWGLDFGWTTGNLRKSIEAIKLQLGIDPNLKITPQIISESWLADPQKLPNNQGFIETIQNEWIPLYQRPEQFHP